MALSLRRVSCDDNRRCGRGLAGGLLFAVIGGVGAFLVSAFVTGGALTLLDIGDSLHRLVEIAEKRDAESTPRHPGGLLT